MTVGLFRLSDSVGPTIVVIITNWGGTLEPWSLFTVIKADMETYGVETLEGRSVMGKFLWPSFL